jgi:glutathione synthase/RimK-type ligase-like ATP-grasp enzyme
MKAVVQPKILVLTVGADYAKEVDRTLVRALRRAGSIVECPPHNVAFAKTVGITRDGWKHGFAPDLIVNLHYECTPLILEALQLAEATGTFVVNRPSCLAQVQDRVRLRCTLLREKIPMPDFYYGHPTHIPKSIGSRAVKKPNIGHLVAMVGTQGIHTHDESVHLERVVPNRKGVVRSVYYVFGFTFTVVKSDTLQTRNRTKYDAEDDSNEIKIVERLAHVMQLDVFGVDFIGGRVIDVNAFPNFFFHREARKVFVKKVMQLAAT